MSFTNKFKDLHTSLVELEERIAARAKARPTKSNWQALDNVQRSIALLRDAEAQMAVDDNNALRVVK